MHRNILILAGLLLLATPLCAAAQYEAKPGNRALELRGTDAVSNGWVDMDDYRGKWVLAEFWATW